MTSPEPIMSWDSEEPWLPGIVWWTRLDNRFQIEVQRQGREPHLSPSEGVEMDEDAYKANLIIFDHRDQNKVLLNEEVSLSYGAAFGPDVADVNAWQERCIKFVDEEL